MRRPTPKFPVDRTLPLHLSRPEVAASARQQQVDPLCCYAYTRVGHVSWQAAKQEYLQMSEADRLAFWAQAEKERADGSDAVRSAAVA